MWRCALRRLERWRRLALDKTFVFFCPNIISFFHQFRTQIFTKFHQKSLKTHRHFEFRMVSKTNMKSEIFELYARAITALTPSAGRRMFWRDRPLGLPTAVTSHRHSARAVGRPRTDLATYRYSEVESEVWASLRGQMAMRAHPSDDWGRDDPGTMGCTPTRSCIRVIEGSASAAFLSGSRLRSHRGRSPNTNRLTKQPE